MGMNATITFELESGIREQLAAICAQYNLSLEEAFTLFAEAVVQAGRFPYDMEVPNAVTQAAMAAAEKGEDLLREMIGMDDGAAFLGECALVPYDSPICQSGLLFYNTLFDENAACHLALGMGFADTICGFEEKTLEECRALGVNDSMVHEDFMIGSADMSIDAVCEDGRTVPIFRDGSWAF